MIDLELFLEQNHTIFYFISFAVIFLITQSICTYLIFKKQIYFNSVTMIIFRKIKYISLLSNIFAIAFFIYSIRYKGGPIDMEKKLLNTVGLAMFTLSLYTYLKLKEDYV
ncbi:MAG: hypothetical protein N4A54_06235 [Peptostreptococcaceae bacterium]|jgi:hypothetical protein|nr:hypothetical protein [Peptostreptococcaceae bacterium]